MSIATAITNAQNKVAAAYVSVSTMGGTLPATQDLSNLPTAIESIPSGGGSTVIARAVNTEAYTTDDKVILVPTTFDSYPFLNVVFDSALYSHEANLAGTTDTYQMLCGIGCGGQLTYDVVDGAAYFRNRNTACFYRNTWDASYSSLTGSTKTINSSNPYYAVCYDGKVPIAGYAATTSYGEPRYTTFGTIVDGVYKPLFLINQTSYGVSTAVDRYFKCLITNYTNVYRVNENNTLTTVDGGARNSIPAYYNGTWYVIKASGVVATFDDPSTQVDTCSGFFTYTDGPGVKFFDNKVDYLWEFDYGNGNVWRFRKITKTGSGWSMSNLTSVASAYEACLRGGFKGQYSGETYGALKGWQICSKDQGSYVESFVVGNYFGYDTVTGVGNKVAHLIFDKATETVKRLPDVFIDIPDTYKYAGNLQVNWDAGLISVCVGYRISLSGGDHTAIFVKKLDDLSKIYQFFAYPNETKNYLTEALTGFVDTNDGVNALGDTELTVSTTIDPTASPWSNVGLGYGFNVIVNEGEPL